MSRTDGGSAIHFPETLILAASQLNNNEQRVIAAPEAEKVHKHRRRAHDGDETYALIPLVLLVVVSVCGVLLTAPSTMSNLGYVLTRTFRAHGVTCPSRDAQESGMSGCGADDSDTSAPSQPAGVQANAPTPPHQARTNTSGTDYVGDTKPRLQAPPRQHLRPNAMRASR